MSIFMYSMLLHSFVNLNSLMQKSFIKPIMQVTEQVVSKSPGDIPPTSVPPLYTKIQSLSETNSPSITISSIK